LIKVDKCRTHESKEEECDTARKVGFDFIRLSRRERGIRKVPVEDYYGDSKNRTCRSDSTPRRHNKAETKESRSDFASWTEAGTEAATEAGTEAATEAAIEAGTTYAYDSQNAP